MLFEKTQPRKITSKDHGFDLSSIFKTGCGETKAFSSNSTKVCLWFW